MPDAVVPFVLQPSFDWYGNDGNWSTFVINAGTPPQSFHVLPSTGGGEIWLPVSEGCSLSGTSDCAATRGVLSIDGVQSPGFQTNESSTWQNIGIYALGFEENLFGPDDSGLYGLDTVSLELSNGSSVRVAGQEIAGIATNNFWLGRLGLGVVPSNFAVRQENVSSLLTSLVNSSLATSQSYGYSAGASYRSAAGGLVFGGYDQDAFTPSNVEFDVYFSGARSLTASLRSVVVTNTLEGTRSLPTGPYNMSIDSTVSQLWLPQTLCDSLEDLLGLTYDASTDLYLVNASARTRLESLSPEFTFTLAPGATTNVTTNIVLPYASFDQQIGLPTYENSTAYFPIRRAANESQFVLGRTFLQEAYLVVDWERQNFTLGQSLHRSGVSNNLMPIILESDSVSSGLAVGAIAGIAVGAVVAIILGCVLGWWFWRKKRRNTKISAEATTLVEDYPEDKKAAEEFGGPQEMAVPVRKVDAELEPIARYELHNEQMKHQLMSEEVYELAGNSAEHELDGQHSREETASAAPFSPDTVRSNR